MTKYQVNERVKYRLNSDPQVKEGIITAIISEKKYSISDDTNSKQNTHVVVEENIVGK
ncbi:2867_t:CDS:2, partial [Diversispora eburnea]